MVLLLIIIASPLNNLMCESFSKWGSISYAYNANVRTPTLLRAKRFDVLETAPENLVEPGALRPFVILTNSRPCPPDVRLYVASNAPATVTSSIYRPPRTGAFCIHGALVRPFAALRAAVATCRSLSAISLSQRAQPGFILLAVAGD